MSYQECLEAAGAEIIDTKYAGSYQGAWGSICNYNGEKILVVGSYGSCSGCDAFMAEFDYILPYYDEDDNKYYKTKNDYWSDIECTKEEYEEKMNQYKERMVDFAQSYLTTPYRKEDIEREIDNMEKENGEDDYYWDYERLELFKWALTFFNN